MWHRLTPNKIAIDSQREVKVAIDSQREVKIAIDSQREAKNVGQLNKEKVNSFWNEQFVYHIKEEKSISMGLKTAIWGREQKSWIALILVLKES